MCMFLCADSVLAHRLPSDSLITSCPHITSLTVAILRGSRSRGRRKMLKEEGAKQCGRLRQDILNTLTLRTHWRAACKSISTAELQSKGPPVPTGSSERAEESHFCMWDCVCVCTKNRKVVFVV